MGVDEVSRVLFWVFETTLLLMLIEGRTLAEQQDQALKGTFLITHFIFPRILALKTMI